MQNLINLVKHNKETVGIIGLGYVGLPLAIEFASKNINVIGFDLNKKKIKSLNDKVNYIKDINEKDFQEALSKNIKFSYELSLINKCDVIIICVPTPLDRFKKPDMSYVEGACKSIAKNMKREVFISLESTTYPTTTEEFILPIIENNSNYKHKKDFYLGYSPERVDPGNKKFNTKNTPKVLGALTPDGLKIGEVIYGKVISKIHLVSSPRIAEMVKILENTYRLVNISLINEISLLCGKMDIDIYEVIEAAKTKPFGFQAFYPGPGIGGHCIPLDPFYLEYIAKKYDFDLTMIETSGHINMRMPYYMFNKISSLLNKNSISVNGSNLLFLGVAYKANISDERESPALRIIDRAILKGANVSYNDPYIPEIYTNDKKRLKSIEINSKILKKFDCVIITTNHSDYDPEMIYSNSKLIVDLRGIMKDYNSDKIFKL